MNKIKKVVAIMLALFVTINQMPNILYKTSALEGYHYDNDVVEVITEKESNADNESTDLETGEKITLPKHLLKVEVTVDGTKVEESLDLYFNKDDPGKTIVKALEGYELESVTLDGVKVEDSVNITFTTGTEETKTLNVKAKKVVEEEVTDESEEDNSNQKTVNKTKERASTSSTLAADNTYTVEVGETIDLSGSGKWSYSHQWSSSNESIATVQGERKTATVTGVSEGSVIITHTYGAFGEESFNVNVIAAVPTITGASEVVAGRTINLTAKNFDGPVEWNSSDPDIATVDQNGVVTGIKKGTVTIYATYGTTQIASKEITVNRDETDGHYVYLYTHADGDTDGLKLELNKDGWYTIGRVFVKDIQDPKDAPQDEVYIKSGTEWDKVMEALNDPSNIDLYGVNSININDIAWNHATEDSGLRTAKGASNYEQETGDNRAWHLDGYVYFDSFGSVTFHYIEKGTGKTLHDDRIDTTKVTDNLEYTKYIASISGYKYVGANPESISVEKGNPKEVTFYYEKNSFEYTINYYLLGDKGEDGKPKEGAKPFNSVKRSGKFGDTVLLNPVDYLIEGYTIYPNQNIELPITANPDNNVINLYYYKNVTVTADDKTKVYGTDNPEFTATTVGTLNGDKVTYNIVRDEGEDVGTYTITPTGAEIQGNYCVKYLEGTLTITPDTKEVTVKITGNSATKTYNAKEQSVTGFTTNVTDKTIEVALKDGSKAEAKGTDAGTYKMGLTADDFDVTSDNYSNIKVVVEDGTLTITPDTKEVTVKITGNSDSKVYNAKEQSVTGFTTNVTDKTIEVALKDGSKAEAKGTDAGTYKMGLTADDFDVTSDNYSNIKVVVEDGTLTITPDTKEVTVKITGKKDTKVYEKNKSYTVEGYNLVSDNDLYKTSFVSYEGNSSQITKTNVGDYSMGLVAEDFENTSKNFNNVKFVVEEDGSLTILGQVSYDGNGSNDALPVDDNTYHKEQLVSVSSQKVTREGATFMGWSLTKVDELIDSQDELDNAGIITETKMGTESITLYAVWAKDDNGDDIPDMYQVKAIFNANNGTVLDSNGNEVEEIVEYITLYNADNEPDVNGTGSIQNTGVVNLKADEGFAFDYWTMDDNFYTFRENVEFNKSRIMFTKQNPEVEFTANFAEDKVSTDPEHPNTADNVPDKYQALVTYRANNGTVSLDRTYVTLFDADGNWSENGTGHLVEGQIATGTANTGYVGGTWNVVPTTALDIKADTEFVITYTIGSYPLTINYVDEEGNPVTAAHQSDVVYNTEYSIPSPEVEGYALMDLDDAIISGIMDADGETVNVVYSRDVIGTDPTNPDNGDNVPDRYQALVNYTATNGTVSLERTYVTLFDADGNWSEDGVGYLSDEQIATATANTGYNQDSLAWAPNAPATNVEIGRNGMTFAAAFDLSVVVTPITPTPVAPAPAAPATPVAPAAAVAAAPVAPVAPAVETVEDNATPLAEDVVEDNTTPLAKAEGTWALVNLICAIVTVLFGFILLISKKKKEEDEDDEYEEEPNEKKRGTFTRVLSVITAIISVIAFILTEDMTLKMIMVDKWTIMMLVITVIQIVIFAFGRKWKDNDDKDQQAYQQA